MLPTEGTTDYKKLLSELVKKQMLILGPDITFAKVKSVGGITIDNEGNVENIEGDPQQVLQNLINQFVELSGMIVKKTMESILTSYPAMMGLATASMGVPVAPLSPQTPQMVQPSHIPVTADSAQVPSTPEPTNFSPTEMDELNKALEDLSKAPLSSETQPHPAQ